MFGKKAMLLMTVILCTSDAFAAVRPQAAAVRLRVAFTRRSLKGSYLLLLAPIVWRSSRASRAQS